VTQVKVSVANSYGKDVVDYARHLIQQDYKLSTVNYYTWVLHRMWQIIDCKPTEEIVQQDIIHIICVLHDEVTPHSVKQMICTLRRFFAWLQATNRHPGWPDPTEELTFTWTPEVKVYRAIWSPKEN
jgi:site-specific recombinase XerD